jgi:hypothetical protein
VNFLFGIEHGGHFESKSSKPVAHEVSAIVDFEGQAFAEVQVIIEEVRVQNSLIADEGASDDAREFILLSESTCRQREYCHQRPSSKAVSRTSSLQDNLFGVGLE